jgi:hypothetical protein
VAYNTLTNTLALGVDPNPVGLVDINGNPLSMSVDANTNLNVTLGSLIAGEDLTYNVMKVEERGTYAIINSNTSTNVKGSTGFLFRIVIGDPGTSWLLTCYDNTSASGTPFIIKPVYGSLTYNFTFSTGLYIVPSGTTAGNAVIVFR